MSERDDAIKDWGSICVILQEENERLKLELERREEVDGLLSLERESHDRTRKILDERDHAIAKAMVELKVSEDTISELIEAGKQLGVENAQLRGQLQADRYDNHMRALESEQAKDREDKMAAECDTLKARDSETVSALKRAGFAEPGLSPAENIDDLRIALFHKRLECEEWHYEAKRALRKLLLVDGVHRDKDTEVSVARVTLVALLEQLEIQERLKISSVPRISS